MIQYDAVFVPGKEPNPVTWQFPKHLYQCLDRALVLQHTGVVKYIALSGLYARWFDDCGITPPFESECAVMRAYLLAPERPYKCPPELILQEKLSQNTIANFVLSGRDVFIPNNIKTVLMLAAKERVPRLDFLCKKILSGVATVHFEIIGSDSRITQKESFTHALQEKSLKHIPDGPAGWAQLQATFFEGGLGPFWVHFDASQKALEETMGSTDFTILDIVNNMNHESLPTDLINFAITVAKKIKAGPKTRRQHS